MSYWSVRLIVGGRAVGDVGIGISSGIAVRLGGCSRRWGCRRGRRSCSRYGRLRDWHVSTLGSDPGRELRLRKDLHRDRHEAMTRAAQLGTLAEINARAVNL